MRTTRVLLLPLGAAAAIAFTMPSWADGSGGTGGPGYLDPDHSDIVKPMPQQLDQLGQEMKITPDQQPAWQNYVNATESVLQPNNAMATTGATGADAAAAQEHEQKVKDWAAASDELDRTLSQSQRWQLDHANGEMRPHIE